MNEQLNKMKAAIEARVKAEPAAVGRTAVERRPYLADFAKCGGGRRVVEAPRERTFNRFSTSSRPRRA